jgi:hypothetical protein
MASADAAPLHGGCHCGALRFAIRAVFDCLWCHCGDCRKTTGAPATVSVIVRRDDFALESGTPVSHQRRNGVQFFCGGCGGGWHYAWTTSGGDMVSIGVGGLDDPEAVRPQGHQFDARRLGWLALDDGLPRYRDGVVPHPDRRR